MARHLPSLNALKAFEAAARLGSFSLAAEELGVTHAAVSRHIRDLEIWLGTKLFVRTGRGVELTDRGSGYAADITRGFDLFATATESVVGGRRRRRQRLVVSVEPSLASLWLVPRLGRFTSAHPDIDLTLDSTSRLADFSRNEADLGIRYGQGPWRDVASEKLTAAHLTPVGSPAYLAARSIAEPRDLEAGMLLQEEQRQYWNEWLDKAGMADRLAPDGPRMSGHLTFTAAEAGQGLALADQMIAGDALVGGRLVRPFSVAVSHYAYFLVRDAARKETRAMAAFGAWLRHEIAQTLDAVARVPTPGTAPAERVVPKRGARRVTTSAGRSPRR